MYPFGITLDDVYRMLLLMFRTGALLSTVPVFSHVSVPRMVRVWLMILFAVMLFPSVAVSNYTLPATFPQLAMVILSELAIGFTMGFAIIIVFAAVQFAGHLIGLEMGLAIANVVDPMSAGELSIIGEFFYLVSLLVFLMIDGHHAVIEALVRSYQIIPIAGGVFSANVISFIIQLTGNVFVLGIKLSAPVIITLFIVNIVLGIIARTVPQMNVFIIGFTLAVAVGLLMIELSFPYFQVVLEDSFQLLQSDLARIMQLLAG